MERLATPHGWTAPAASDAVSLPRRHLVVIAALVCVPLPLLSFGAMILPLPQLLERGAATFAALAVPSVADDGMLRERAPGRALVIRYRPNEPSEARTPRQPAATKGGERLAVRTDRGATSPARGSSSTGAALHPLAPEPQQAVEPAPTESPEAPATSSASEITAAGTKGLPTSTPSSTTRPQENGPRDGATSGGGSGSTTDPGSGELPGNGAGTEPGSGGHSGEEPAPDPPGSETGNGKSPEPPPQSNKPPSPPGQGRP